MEADIPLQQTLDAILQNSDLSSDVKGEKLLDRGVQLVNEFRKTSDIAKLQCAIDCLDHSLEMIPNSGSRVRNNLAIALNMRFLELEDLRDFERSLNLHEDALRFFKDELNMNVDETLPGYVDKGTTLNYIGNRMEKRFDMTSQIDDLFEAIKFHEEALLLHPPGHRRRARSLDNLADALSRKFDLIGNQEDFDSAIQLHKEALELEPPGDEGRFVTLNQLGNKLRTRYERLGDENDLNTALVYLKECLSLLSPTHKDRLAALSNVAATLMRRFQKTGDMKDTSDAIAFLEEALSCVPPGHPTRRLFLLNLAASFTLRFNICEHKEDLDKAIALYEEGASLSSLDQRGRVTSLHELANRLITRYKRFGDVDYVNRAVEYDTDALNLCPAVDNNRAYCLGKLAETLSVRFHAVGQDEDLNSAINMHKEALVILPSGHSDRESMLHSLAIEYALRFETLGQEEDLNMAISTIEEVLLLRHEGHPSRARSLSVLGRLLLLRFDLLGYKEDLDNAVKFSFESLALHQANGDVEREASLNNLANALWTKYEVFSDKKDLDIAILLNEEALSMQPPGHWNRRISLNNLAGCLSQRFSISGDTSDLEAALRLQEMALQVERGQNQWSSHNYAQLLLEKYQKFHNREDLDLAISTYQEALHTAFKDSPFRPQCMLSLGIALGKRFESSKYDVGELDVIFELFEEVSSMTSQFGIAFRAAQIWANSASKYNHPSMAKAYRAAIKLLPLLVPMTFDSNSRTRNLLNMHLGLVADAAAQAIHQTKSYDEAIELLEAGRSVFWSQAMQSSPDLNRLSLVAPELANQLRIYSEDISKSEKYADGHIPMSAMSTRSVSSLKALQDSWVQTLEQIRGIPGFEDFLRPLSIHRLRVATAHGIIVLMNSTASSCDALIMTPQEDDIIHVPLPNIDSVFITGIVELLKWVVDSQNKGGAEIDLKIDHFTELVEFTLPSFRSRYGKVVGSRSTETYLAFILPAILDLLWQKFTLPIISALNLKKSTNPPRLWWCPTGPLTFLPLHAAGSYPYSSNRAIESISDYVISSYTATLTALIGETSDLKKDGHSKFKLLGVADTKNLLLTEEEIHGIRKYVPIEYTVELGTSNNPPASIDVVCSEMGSASVVHFACHGHQVQENPLQSGLQLEDGNLLSMDKVMQLSIPNASLAFLSACETATGSEKLPDEALHVGSSLIFAGFKSVIATMWKIEDEDGPVIADAFYRNLFEHVDFESLQSNGFDATKSAEALHKAIKEMQECGIPPHRWVPFIHIGK